MTDSGHKIPDRQSARHWLSDRLDLIVMMAALAALIIWCTFAAANPPVSSAEAVVAGSHLSEPAVPFYPTQRENGLPAFDHGR